MIYIQQVGIINYKQQQQVEIKAQCKLVAPTFIRRTDDFIQLAILGVEQIKRKVKIPSNCALYITSGQGDLGVFQRLCDQRFIEKSPPKPVDFINSLSNTAGFYVSQFLNLESKNSNLSHLNFIVEMALLLAKSDILLGKEESILFGGVDQLLSSTEFYRATLGLSNTMPLAQGSNWMLLNSIEEGALARLYIENKEMDRETLSLYLDSQQGEYQLAFSLLMDEQSIDSILQETKQNRFLYETETGFYETVALYALNKFILCGNGKLLFIDYFQSNYRVIKIEVL